MSDDSHAIDALLDASVAQGEELKRRSGIDAAMMLALSLILKELKISPVSDEQLEKLKTSFLFSRIQDQEIDSAHKALGFLLQNQGYWRD